MRTPRFTHGRLAIGASAAAMLGLAVLAAGCGSSSSETSGANSTATSISTAPPPTPATCETKGGTLKILSAGDVDHIDPGEAYYSFAYEVTRPTQRALLVPKPGSTEVIPDLAAGMPTVSKDGKTVTVTLKAASASARRSTAR